MALKIYLIIEIEWCIICQMLFTGKYLLVVQSLVKPTLREQIIWNHAHQHSKENVKKIDRNCVRRRMRRKQIEIVFESHF